ncbi:MAG TPA: hypothetical protein VFQ53_12900 [Kofleriaceae bacterium]|nr:hypothetical protein [Kofleriaceae bacterium]
MKHGAWLVVLGVLAGCPGDDDGGGGNAATLWLAPDGMETEVRLVETEPPPF